MATKKKNSPSDPESKTDLTREACPQDEAADDIWQRLGVLGQVFHDAGLRDRSRDLVDMGRVLRQLSRDAEFRKVAYSSLRTYLSKELQALALPAEFSRLSPEPSKRRALKRTSEGDFLLETVKYAIAGGGHPKNVARVILLDLPLCPELYTEAKDAPGIEDLSRVDGDSYRAAAELVKEAIDPLLDDPDDVDPESVLRAALRALGCDAKYVNNVLRA